MAGDAYLIGQLIASLGLNSAEFNAGMAAAQSQMAAADAAMEKASISIQAQMTAIGTKMQVTGKMMNRYMTLPILAIGAASFSAQKDFESSMSKIEGLVGTARSEVDQLSKSVLELSPSVGRGPEELADALFFIQSAGIKGADSMDVLNMSARASVAGLGETKTVADLVTSAMNAYGKENLNAAMATDILVAAVREGKAEADQIAGAMGAVIPLASEMGVTFDQLGAALAGMTRTGTEARVATTQIKAILASLKKPTDDAKDALGDMGLSAQGLRDKIRQDGLISTLELLRTTTNKYGEEMVSRVFPNIRALVGMLDLMGANMEDNIGISERMADSTGSLDKAFDAAAQTTQFKWDQAIAQVKTTLVELGTAMKDVVLPAIEGITKKIKEFTDKLSGMTEAEKQAAVKTALLAAALGPVLSILGKITKAIAANPYTALAVAILAVAAGTVKWVKANRELFDGMAGVEKVEKEVNKRINEQSVEVDRLTRMIHNENLSNETRLNYIGQLKKIIPEYTAELSDEGTIINENTTAIEDYLTALREKIRLQAFEEEYTKLLEKQLKVQGKIAAATAQAASPGGGLIGEARLLKLNAQYDRLTEEINEMEEAAANLNITLGKTPDVGGTGGGGGGTGGTGGTGGGGGGGTTPSDFTQTQLNRIELFTEAWKEAQDEANAYSFDAWDSYIQGLDDNIQESLRLEEAATRKKMKLADELSQHQIDKAKNYIAMAKDVGAAVGAIIGGQEGAFKGFVSTILGGIQRVIDALLIEAIAGMTAREVLTKGPLGLISAAIGVAALHSFWNANVPEFAEGALAYGPVIGKMGEYPGAATNPEVIAPLSDLQKILFGSGGGVKTIKLILEGEDAYALVSMQELLQNTY